MATFRAIAAHSVDHLFSLYILVISRFGFEGWIWVLIASVPGLCIVFTFNRRFNLMAMAGLVHFASNFQS